MNVHIQMQIFIISSSLSLKTCKELNSEGANTHIINMTYIPYAFSALTLLVGQKEGHLA